jgi:hypothetical protein
MTAEQTDTRKATAKDHRRPTERSHKHLLPFRAAPVPPPAAALAPLAVSYRINDHVPPLTRKGLKLQGLRPYIRGLTRQATPWALLCERTSKGPKAQERVLMTAMPCKTVEPVG